MPMTDNKGRIVDLLVPRTCSITHKLISCRDHGAIQFNVSKPVDGQHQNNQQAFAVSGTVRNKGKSDAELTKLFKKMGLYPNIADCS